MFWRSCSEEHTSLETVRLLLKKKKAAGMSSRSRGQTFHSLLAGEYKATEGSDEKHRTSDSTHS